MLYPLLKACHVISIVCWFAGLLYIGRLFIYYVDAHKKDPNEKEILQKQYAIMMRRLWYGITTPAMLLSFAFGLWLMIEFQLYKHGWFHIKLLFVIATLFYHLALGRIRKNLMQNKSQLNSIQLRLLNELGTALLIIIVLVAYLKNHLSGIWTFVIFLAAVLTLYVSVLIMNKMKSHSHTKDNHSP